MDIHIELGQGRDAVNRADHTIPALRGTCSGIVNADIGHCSDNDYRIDILCPQYLIEICSVKRVVAGFLYDYIAFHGAEFIYDLLTCSPL